MTSLYRHGFARFFPWAALCWALVCNHPSAWSQTGTAPDEGIQSRPAAVVLLKGGHVVVSPERELDSADVLIRDGKIAEVAASITPPPDAEVIDCTGKTLYAAFIDPIVEVAIPTTARPDDHWNTFITPQRTAVSSLPADDKVAAGYRKAGFGAIVLAPSDNIIKGTSAVVTTAKLPPAQTVLRPQAFQHMALVKERSERGGYPNSPMGVVALTRQTLSDAQWYQQAQQAFHADSSLPAPDKNGALEALGPLVRGEQTALFDSGNELYALRADRMAREFNLRAIIRGSGREYRRMDAIVESGRTFIVPVDFPRAPEVSTLDAAASASLQALMHWQLAPENPARLEAANVNFVLTASGLSSPTDLLEAVRKAIARGLSPQTALSALTTRTARLLEIDHLVGSIERGKLANILIASGPLWDKKSTIQETWVQGKRYEWQDKPEIDASARWKLTVNAEGNLPKELELQLESMTDKPKGMIGLSGEIEKAAKSAAPAGRPARRGESKEDTKDDTKEPVKPTDKPEKPLELKKPDSDNPPKDDSKPVVPAPVDKADAPKPDEPKDGAEKSEPDKEKPTDAEKSANAVELKGLTASDYRIESSFDAKKLVDDQKGTGRLSLTLLKSDDGKQSLIGRILWPSGEVTTLTGQLQAADKQDQDKQDEDKKKNEKATEEKKDDKKDTEKKSEVVCEVNYPLGAFGVATAPTQPEWLLIKGGTVWTADAQGTLENTDVLVHRGIIKEVGKGLTAPEGATIVDATGKHVSPGIIDCHSHMATDGGVNESGQAITAEVRIGDFIDSNDMNIYYQLAGGVTCANILHGSANPIGGQNQVIKLRWGASDEAMKMREAPQGIKFALGENVKQSNFGERASGRYPQTRMGVEQIFRDRFEAAKLYKAARAAGGSAKGLPFRRDYELDAIVEILDRQRWVHCHSYRQDEILAFLRVLDDYGVTVGSLQHILEGYKVADAMAKHGATGSTFSDWWAYKFEVIDAIPYNGALMHRAGIIVSFNSDDDELARHLNHEAAKAVKYGGLKPEEAIQFVTLNPAKQLRIDQYVGSIAVGKQADLVVWSGSPLSTLSRCEQTWIDGRKYFDREVDAGSRKAADDLRRKLIAKVIDSGEKTAGDGRDRRDPSLWFVRYDEFCHHVGHDHDDEGEHMHDHESEHADAETENAGK